MGLIWRIAKLVLLAVSAVLFVTISVTNRHDVQLVLDPFNSDVPAVGPVTGPFFAFLFGALFFGIVLGGFASWLAQGKWRKTARQRTREAYRWKQEADRLTHERDVAARPGLPATS